MHHAEEILEATCASAETAKALTIKAKSALLIVHRVVFTESGGRIGYKHIIVPTAIARHFF